MIKIIHQMLFVTTPSQAAKVAQASFILQPSNKINLSQNIRYFNTVIAFLLVTLNLCSDAD